MIDMILAVDFGNTIEYKNSFGVMTPFDGVYEVLTACTRQIEAVHIVSKVNERQEREVRAWLTQTNFMAKVGIPPENLHFCAERKDKGPIFERLGVTHAIDDRPEVMAYAPERVIKYLFRPRDEEVTLWFNSLVNTKIVYSWKAIAAHFERVNGLNMPIF